MKNTSQLELPVVVDVEVRTDAGVMELFRCAYEAMELALRRESLGLALWSRIRDEQKLPGNEPML